MQTIDLTRALDYLIHIGGSILAAVVIFFVGRALIGLINRLLERMLTRRGTDPSIASFLRSAAGIVLNILLVVTVVSALGVDTTSFAALIASAGVAIGMALSGNLQNLAGGLIILLFKPYKVGDYVEAQGAQGTVSEIQIFHTILTTVDHKRVYIPNGAMSSGSVTNFSLLPQRRVDITVGIDYGEDVDRVRRVLNQLIDADQRILRDPAPDILLLELAASSVNLQLRLWVEARDYFPVLFSMNETIYKTFNREGINFPYPQLTVHNS